MLANGDVFRDFGGFFGLLAAVARPRGGLLL